MFASAIARYHDGLAQGDTAVASAELLERLLRSEGLFFGDRALCSVLRPRLLTPGEYRHVARACALVGSAFEAVRLAAMHDSASLYPAPAGVSALYSVNLSPSSPEAKNASSRDVGLATANPGSS